MYRQRQPWFRGIPAVLVEQTSLPGTHRLWSLRTACSGNPSQGQVSAM